MKKTTGIALLLSGLTLFTGQVVAEKAERGVYNDNCIGASMNPLGVLVDNKLFWRMPLSVKPGPLWESAKLDVGIQNTWSPADEVFAARIAFEPIALFSLTGSAGLYGMYTALGYGMYPFPSANDAYCSSPPKEVKPQSAFGTWLSIAPELRLKIKRLILVNTCTADYLSLNRSGYFLELRNYALHATKGGDLVNCANLLVECNKLFLTGAAYRYLKAFGTDIKSHRVSALAIALFPKSRFGNCFCAGTAGYYIADPALGGAPYAGMMAGTNFKVK
jgi:hypothetical protein